MMRIASKWLKRILISALVLVLLISLFLAGALFTNAGLKAVLWGAQKALPAFSVDNEKTEGALFPRFSLYDVGFKDKQLTVDMQLDSLTLAINPHCFLKPSVCVDDLKLTGLQFELAELPPSESEPEESQETSAEIDLPIAIQISNVEFDNIALNILGHKIDWKRFSTRISMEGRTLTIAPTQLHNINVELAKTESNEKSEKVDNSKPSSEPITLPEVDIPLEIDLQQFELKDFTLKGDSPVVVNSLILEAHADHYDVDVQKLELDVPQADLKLNTKVSLRDDYPLELSAKADVKQTDLKGQKLLLSADGSVGELNLKATLSEVIEASIEGKLEPLDPKLPFDIALGNGYVKWPFTGSPEYFVDVDALQANGSLDGYKLLLDTKVEGEAIPDLELKLAGKGDLSQVELESMTLNTLGGEVVGQVMANWEAPINWQATLGLSDIQPGLQWEEAEGSISGSLVTSGNLTESGGWHVLVPELDIQGNIRDYPLELEGDVEALDQNGKGDIQVNTNGLTVRHGPNGIYLSGNIDKSLNLDTKIDFPDIAKSVPDLKGSLSGVINLRGELTEPKLETELTAHHIAYQDIAKIDDVSLVGDLSPLPVPEGQISLSVVNIEAQDKVIDSLDISFAGTQEKHGLSVSMLSEMMNLSLHIAGGLEEKPSMKWVGSLDKADFSTEQGPWSLDHPVALSFLLKEQIAKIQAHCWSQANSSVCLTKDITAGKSGEAEVAIKNFDFEQVDMFLPKETELHGAVDVFSSAKWSPDTDPEAKVQVSLSNGKVVQHDEQNVELGWDKITANALLKNNKLSLDWLFDLTDNGVISGDALIPDVKAKEQTLDANLVIQKVTMEMIEPLLGEYSQLDAQVDSNLSISGPILHPAIKGELSLHDIVVLGEITPIDVQKGRVNLTFSGYEALLDADIESADGLLTIDGDAGWKDMAAWHTNIKVHSDELNVDLPPMVKVRVKPEMTISVTPTLARIDGDIYLPWGRISVEELPPSAVSVSSDQVILDKNLKPVKESTQLPMALETDVNIHIGDEFKLSAFGLKGGLKGQLNVSEKDKGPFIVGEINVKNGTYRSFGQDLIIKEGKILMNGPADLPYLQVNAIRNPDNTTDDVTAGIKVTGPASEPIIEIYSTPAMPQQNALSYLLRGQDIDGESGGNAMTTALIGLSLAKSGQVVGEIGEAFGVSDLQLDTAGSGDDSQVTVSGYILPGLQVKYGVGIFDSFGEFTVRYRLMTDLYVEAVSGMDSAVDLLYQFEFD
ncbi:translocation/assembly module TamB domain-containing protein [Vibrio sp. HN007]|uniref:autotransporter assembly complex protein TamB n=1 Tax=Vibrio iocasae TaxID=3098914 RepID=UPI0035D45007